MSDLQCPLCSAPTPAFYHSDKRREYVQCAQCHLVFVPPAYLPDVHTEKNEYLLHENSYEDRGYRQFLAKAADPLCQHIAPPAAGLDYGCGPTPVLAKMLTAKGHQMQVYDPYFHPDKTPLQQQYDFITCTEAIEHFHSPAKELAILDSCLKKGGWLCVMTKRVLSQARFAQWHYKNDMTHVSFFSDETFYYIGRNYGYTVHLISADVVLMHKQSYNRQF